MTWYEIAGLFALAGALFLVGFLVRGWFEPDACEACQRKVFHLERDQTVLRSAFEEVQRQKVGLQAQLEDYRRGFVTSDAERNLIKIQLRQFIAAHQEQYETITKYQQITGTAHPGELVEMMQRSVVAAHAPTPPTPTPKAKKRKAARA